MKDAPLRVAVIGAGPTTVFAHLPLLAHMREQGLLVLAVVCDIVPERARQARQQFDFVEHTGDATTALARSDIDAVYIFGSAQMHFEYGRTALENGKHLFVEKPIAPSYQEAMQLVELARTRRLIAVGGLNRRFFKSLQVARTAAAQTGWRMATVTFHKAEYGKHPSFGARTWLSANGIHALDAMLYMMGGVPDEITSMAANGSAGAPSVFTAAMRWSDGAQGTFLCNNSAGARREEYVFHGPGETYTIADAGLTVSKNNVVNRFELPLIGDGFEAEHDAFVRAIRTGSPPPHAIEAIAPSLFVAELIENGVSGRVQLPARTIGEALPQRAARTTSILVVPSPELQPLLARLLPSYRLVSIDDVLKSPHQRPDIEAAILGRGSAPLSAEALDKLPQLGVVGIMALSLARHDPQALLARGVTLLNATAAYADSVAEFAFGLAVLGRRRAFISHAVMRAGGWGTQRPMPGIRGLIKRAGLVIRPAVRAVGLEAALLRAWRASRAAGHSADTSAVARDLNGATVGLIGWGANARALTARMRSAKARVLVYSEHASATEIRAADAIPTSLDQVLAADIVSLHRGLTSETRHRLGAPELARLRAGSVLINVARGALIEPEALLARLRQHDVFACLDTFEEEPLSSSHPLRQLPNVFLTSHIAGGSPDMHAAAAEEVVRKVVAHLEGRSSGSISAERLQTMT
jgi:phosphoglycerate dehydrogenase-like enzyme/predicted dehydrogenase